MTTKHYNKEILKVDGFSLIVEFCKESTGDQLGRYWICDSFGECDSWFGIYNADSSEISRDNANKFFAYLYNKTLSNVAQPKSQRDIAKEMLMAIGVKVRNDREDKATQNLNAR